MQTKPQSNVNGTPPSMPKRPPVSVAPSLSKPPQLRNTYWQRDTRRFVYGVLY